MNRLEELEQLIATHKQLYYKGEAQLSDEEYDTLEEELRQLDPNSYMLQRVGYVVSDQKVKHTKPMLSLEKTKDLAELEQWVGSDECIMSEKMDGTAASLIYEQGLFTLAKTRGDGQVGENMTKHFEHISFPDRLTLDFWRSKDVEIRGEVVISKENFDKLSADMESRGLDLPNSIRNIVAGLLHKKSDLDLCKYLTFKAYSFIKDDSMVRSESEIFKTLRSEGFSIPGFQGVDSSNVRKVVESYADYGQPWSGQFLTDGLVIAVSDLTKQLARGFTNHHPKGKIAFKFDSERSVTTIDDILVDVGRTGKVSFVAKVRPVELSGAVISRVTLHNAKYIKDHNINVGAEIEITRSNEVIPKHCKTVTDNGEYHHSMNCPVCGQGLAWSDTHVDLMCDNSICPAKVIGKVEHWIKVVGIDNIGESTLEQLYISELVSDVSDLYRLTPEDLAGLDRMGKRSANKIVKNIQDNREIPLETFLAALGIDGLGRGVSKLLVEEYSSIDDIHTWVQSKDLRVSAHIKDLMKIEGIGEVLAQNIALALTEDKFWADIQELYQLGVVILAKEDESASPLKGMTFVITGSLSKPRKAIQNWIAQRGGKATGSVSAKTTHLVCNAKSSSSKYVKAESLGLPIITEEELEKLGEI